MSPLEMLFRLELEFHRKLRTVAPGIDDDGSLHTNYALQSGYDQFLFAFPAVTDGQIEQLADNHPPALAARVKKPVAAYRSGFFGIKLPSQRSSKENGHLLSG